MKKIILTDVLEFYILELPKFKKYYQNTNNTVLNSWIKFINKPEVIDMEETTKAIKKAKQVLEEISQDEHERYLAELREKYIMDQADIEEAGYDKGYKAAIEQSNQRILVIAKKFKEQNVDFEIISKATGLTIDEIKNL